MSEQGLNPAGGRFMEADSDTIIDGTKRLVWLKKDTWQMAGKWLGQRQVKEFAESLNRNVNGSPVFLTGDFLLPRRQRASSIKNRKTPIIWAR